MNTYTIKKNCNELNCENECLLNYNLCYFHINVAPAISFKQKQLFEAVRNYDNKINLNSEYEYIKSWISPDIYEFVFLKVKKPKK